LTTALAAAAPAVVVDMTAYTEADVKGLLAALPASLVRLVIISSGDVYWTYGAFLGSTPSTPPAAPWATSLIAKQLCPIERAVTRGSPLRRQDRSGPLANTAW
jgi:hypothetical protein